MAARRDATHRESLGRVASVTVLGALSTRDREELAARGLETARLGSLGLTIVLIGVGLALVGLMWLVGRLDA